MSFIKHKRAFTLIELVIVMAITGILVAAAVPVYGNFQGKLQLLDGSSDIVQTLRTARQQAIVGYHDAAHGVYFTIDGSGVDSFTLYQGDSYATRDTNYDQTIELKSSLSLTNSSFTLTGDDIDINFAKGGLGLPGNTGAMILSHSVTGSKTITVNRYGMVEKN